MLPGSSFTIDAKSEIPVWVQIKQRLIYLIVSGTYKAGDQLPTVRELALELGVNYHTVNKVYQRLEGDGLVEIRPGRGTHVLDLSERPFLPFEGNVGAVVVNCAEQLIGLGMTPEEAVEALAAHFGLAVRLTARDGKLDGCKPETCKPDTATAKVIGHAS